MAPPFIRQTSAYIFVIEILKYTFCFGSVGVFVSSSTVKLLPHGEKTVQKQISSLLTACIGFAENLRLSTCSQKVAVNNQHFFASRYIMANREMKPCDLNCAAWIDELAALLVHIPKF